MKKVWMLALCLMLSLCLALSLTACGGNPDTNPDTSVEDTSADNSTDNSNDESSDNDIAVSLPEEDDPGNNVDGGLLFGDDTTTTTQNGTTTQNNAGGTTTTQNNVGGTTTTTQKQDGTTATSTTTTKKPVTTTVKPPVQEEIQDVKLPAAGYDPDGKGRIVVEKSEVKTVDKKQVAYITFANKSKNWIIPEYSKVTFVCYDKNGAELSGSGETFGTLFLGALEVGDKITCHFDIPAGTVEVKITGHNFEYWTPWS